MGTGYPTQKGLELPGLLKRFPPSTLENSNVFNPGKRKPAEHRSVCRTATMGWHEDFATISAACITATTLWRPALPEMPIYTHWLDRETGKRSPAGQALP